MLSGWDPVQLKVSLLPPLIGTMCVRCSSHGPEAGDLAVACRADCGAAFGKALLADTVAASADISLLPMLGIDGATCPSDEIEEGEVACCSECDSAASGPAFDQGLLPNIVAVSADIPLLAMLDISCVSCGSGGIEEGEIVLACCADCDSAASDTVFGQALLPAAAGASLLVVSSIGCVGRCSGTNEAPEVAVVACCCAAC